VVHQEANQRLFQSTDQTAFRLALGTGEAGIGKITLVSEMAAGAVKRAGLPVDLFHTLFDRIDRNTDSLAIR
jgi:hypothetical protein